MIILKHGKKETHKVVNSVHNMKTFNHTAIRKQFNDVFYFFNEQIITIKYILGSSKYYSMEK